MNGVVHSWENHSRYLMVWRTLFFLPMWWVENLPDLHNNSLALCIFPCAAFASAATRVHNLFWLLLGIHESLFVAAGINYIHVSEFPIKSSARHLNYYIVQKISIKVLRHIYVPKEKRTRNQIKYLKDQNNTIPLLKEIGQIKEWLHS